MLCDVFTSRLAYLERNKPMTALHHITRTAKRARKAYAASSMMDRDDLTPKAAKRLDRRTRAARRAVLEAERAADLWADGFA